MPSYCSLLFINHTAKPSKYAYSYQEPSALAHSMFPRLPSYHERILEHAARRKNHRLLAYLELGELRYNLVLLWECDHKLYWSMAFSLSDLYPHPMGEQQLYLVREDVFKLVNTVGYFTMPHFIPPELKGPRRLFNEILPERDKFMACLCYHLKLFPGLSQVKPL
jgi:hypothetical protein